MPRARTNDTEEDIVLPKTRARKPRAISATSESTPAPRKRAPARARVVPAETEPTRKAPTALAQKRRSHSKNTKAFITVLGICVLLSGAGVVIGFMDQGSIDVVAVVNERNEKINKGEVRDEAGNTITQTIQVQTDARPNGGLPMGDAPAVVTPPEPVSTTTQATTTDETASTTDPVEESASTTEPSV